MDNFDIKDFPEHLQYVIQERHDKLLPFYQEHYEDFKEGIWFFLEGYKDNFSLNHLKRRVPCWKAEIEDNAIVYEPNWEKIVTLDDPLVKFGGCYTGERKDLPKVMPRFSRPAGYFSQTYFCTQEPAHQTVVPSVR